MQLGNFPITNAWNLDFPTSLETLVPLQLEVTVGDVDPLTGMSGPHDGYGGHRTRRAWCPREGPLCTSRCGQCWRNAILSATFVVLGCVWLSCGYVKKLLWAVNYRKAAVGCEL